MKILATIRMSGEMIRGAVYQIDLGTPRGHEQRGKRFGLVVSPPDSPLSVATVIPTSASASPGLSRPVVEVAGRQTRLLVDQIRSIDTNYIGEIVGMLDRVEMAEVENVMAAYLGIVPMPTR